MTNETIIKNSMSTSCSMKMYTSKGLYHTNHKKFTYNSVIEDGSNSRSNNDNYDFKEYNRRENDKRNSVKNIMSKNVSMTMYTLNILNWSYRFSRIKITSLANLLIRVVPTI